LSRLPFNFHVPKLHVINLNGHHFATSWIIHMTNHNYPMSLMLHMIKHDPSILQIPYKLHSCDKTHYTPHTIYRHLENEHLLSKNLSREVTFLNVIIQTFWLQFKDVINVTTTWMMLKRSNEVMNLGKT